MRSLNKKKVLMILPPKDFRDEEFFKTRVALQANGAIAISTAKGTEEASGTLGGKARIDLPLDKVVVDDYEAFIFVGGRGAAEYFKDKQILELVRQAAAKKKLLGAICIAPSILANAGLLKGKKATAFPSEETNLKSKGAIFTSSAVQVDGNIVTASGPAAAEEFGRKLAEVLAKK